MSPFDDELVLSLDRGNSTLDCLLQGQGQKERARLEADAAALPRFLAGRVPGRAVGLSAVPGGLETIREQLASLGCELLLAGGELPCPLILDYAPGQLGADRWVAALAACRQFGDSLVVDCGSALTLDLVSAEGRFLGGMIAAGAQALAEGLAARAPSLPHPANGELPQLPPRSSEGALQAGLVLGYASMVDGLLRRTLAACPLDEPRLVLTGGDADLLLAHSLYSFELRPELTHEGLRCLLSESNSRS